MVVERLSGMQEVRGSISLFSIGEQQKNGRDAGFFAFTWYLLIVVQFLKSL